MIDKHLAAYIKNSLFKGRVSRWKKSKLNVFCDFSLIGPYADIDFYTSSTFRAFNEWISALNDVIDFVPIKSSDGADITYQFKWVNFWQQLLSSGSIGSCEYTVHNQTKEFIKAKVKIGLADKKCVYPIMLHEIGHSLGICDHSPAPRDIMFSTVCEKHKQLTENDIRVINILYSYPVGTSFEEIMQTENNELYSSFSNNPDGNNNVENAGNIQLENTLERKLTDELSLMSKLRINQCNIQTPKRIEGNIENSDS